MSLHVNLDDRSALADRAGVRLRSLRIVAIAFASVLLLTWAYWRSDSISTREHQTYIGTLHSLRDVNAQLGASVLANRLGLPHHFDDIVRSLASARARVLELRAVPAFLSESGRQNIQAQIHAYGALLDQRAALIDTYKREITTFENSRDYFPTAAAHARDEATSPALRARVDAFSRGLLEYIVSDDPERARQLAGELRAFDALAGQSTPALQSMAAHAHVVLDGKATVNAVTRAIVDAPSDQQVDQIEGAYAQAFDEARLRARMYSMSLYIAGVLISAYLLVVLFKLDRASGELSATNRALQDKVEALHQSREQLRLYANVFTNAAEGMTITDADARIVAVNPAFSEITGYAEEDILGKTPAVLRSGRHDKAFYREMWDELQHRGQWRGEIWNKRANGDIYPEWISITRVRDDQDRTTHYVGLFSDITERKDAEARIRHLAHHDPLTGLPNRTLLQDRLDQAMRLSRYSGLPTAVMFIDLDRFKAINDTLGHEAGDSLLVEIASRCEALLRDNETIARQGGDEFVVVLPEVTHPQHVVRIARELLAAIVQPHKLGAHELSISASIGIAMYPEDGATGSELLRNADVAMYRAKTEGRNGMQFYSADMNAASLGDLLLENRLRGAIERDELTLAYQPRVAARTGRLVGFEALLRWHDPTLGPQLPARFIPIAEASGLIVPIGAWALRAAASQLRIWLDEGLDPPPVAVNLSAGQFRHDIPELVRDVLAEFALPSRLLELELTESMLMRDVPHAVEVLNRLRAMGVRISIDDFGTGYSSLAYLRLFDVQQLKIDRSFVQDIRPDGPEARIIQAVIALGHSLGQEVVAEGVETDYQRDYLTQRGCDQMQGYLFGEPAAAEIVVAQIKAEQVIAALQPQSR